jgi:PAS domain S-box-containing protein
VSSPALGDALTHHDLTSLREQLTDLQAAVAAIRGGGVDGIMLGDPNNPKLYTLTSADRPYRVIVDEMGEGAATVSERGVLLYVNRRLAELIGRDRRELVGSDLSALVDGAEQPALAELLACTAGETRRAEITLTGPDGGAVSVLASVTGLDLEGLLVRCLVAADLSGRRRAEQRIAAANAAIAAHAADLERANSELTRSNDELAQFAYAASHDLAEPLRTVGGFAELLRERYRGRLDTDADEFIDFITAGTARMQQLINDLLAFSRVDSHADQFWPIDAGRVLDGVVADLGGLLGERNAVLRRGPLPVLPADATQLAQVFANVIRNAVTFVAAGVTPQVELTATPHGSAGDAVHGWRFIVADNGIGIPVQHRERVFGMFKRLHTRQDYPGTGIGLAIVQKVVQRHGGEVWLEDNPDGGTRVNFTLPGAPVSR